MADVSRTVAHCCRDYIAEDQSYLSSVQPLDATTP